MQSTGREESRANGELWMGGTVYNKKKKKKKKEKRNNNFFFFKQKTAYEIYQCDWSSDVCSSDLDEIQKPSA